MPVTHKWDWKSWHIGLVDGLRVKIWGYGTDGAKWHWAIYGIEDAKLGMAATTEDAAQAVERRVSQLVIQLAPLLDDAAKREFVKAAGIGLEHLPGCKDEAESEAEPVL